MKNLTHRLLSLVAAATALVLTGCLEESTVIKVNKDGSGVIHERHYSGAEDAISLPGLSSDDDAKEKEQKKPKMPSEDALRNYAATLGEGVTFKSVKPGTNKKGWGGYEIIYEFEDINKVRYLKNTPKPESDEGEEEEDQDKKDGDDKKNNEMTVTFSMKDGKLAVMLESDDFEKESPAQTPAQAPDSPTIDPYADTTGPAPAQIGLSPAFDEGMMKAMTKGMRMGLFLQIEGEITDTNAAHRKGNLITLYSVDLGKLFENEGGMAAMNQFENADRATFESPAQQFDGLDIDLQEPIEIEFK
jgi:hypothetical protein